MIIVNRKNQTYKNFSAKTKIRKVGDICQVCLPSDNAEELEGGKLRLLVYPLSEILALRQRVDTLIGHPLLDLESEKDVCGYVELYPYQVKKVQKWAEAGDFVGLRNYNRKPGAKDHQVARIRRKGMVKHGLLTEADVLWVRNICDVSHYYLESELAKLVQVDAETEPPAVAKERHPRRKGKLSRKERRQIEQEDEMYGI
ncbi:MAG: hypothetical protein KAJ19_24260 [Gammaproteobacteria bacterium]|nr:hypothetical protein [Gammaproteobacteria bacterium]